MNSPNFTLGPVEIPYRPLEQNSPEALLNHFVKCEQSEREESLYGAPIQLVVTTCQNKGEGTA